MEHLAIRTAIIITLTIEDLVDIGAFYRKRVYLQSRHYQSLEKLLI
jgi:hypothetical protein